MRSAAALLVLVVAVAGCGSQHVRIAAPAKREAPVAGLRIGLVGPLQASVPGALIQHGSLKQVVDDPLVVVAATDPAAASVPVVAVSHPATHFALAGASAKQLKLPNVAGLVIPDIPAALLAGVVAGLTATDEGGEATTVAWVGPKEKPLAYAFARGVRDVAPAAVVLRVWSSNDPASCKEAALSAIGDGATVVAAHGGKCAAAAADGAHEQNQPALELSDFELLDVPTEQVVRDAVGGLYHGHEDLIFGATSGALGIGKLDPLISAATAVRARTAAQQLTSGFRPSG